MENCLLNFFMCMWDIYFLVTAIYFIICVLFRKINWIIYLITSMSIFTAKIWLIHFNIYRVADLVITSLDLQNINSDKMRVIGKYKKRSRNSPHVHFGGVEFQNTRPQVVKLFVNVDFGQIQTRAPEFATFFRVIIQEMKTVRFLLLLNSESVCLISFWLFFPNFPLEIHGQWAKGSISSVSIVGRTIWRYSVFANLLDSISVIWIKNGRYSVF